MMARTARELVAALRTDGGFTEPQPKDGYMVSTRKDREVQVPASIRDQDLEWIIAQYRRANADLLGGPTISEPDHLGAWIEDGVIYLDCSEHVYLETTARALAVHYSQLAYYDVVRGISVSVKREAA